MQGKIRGLTLIEVLIALMILMAVLSTTALVVQTSRQNSAQAAAVIDLLRPLPLILQHVRQQLRQNAPAEATGQGELLGVNFNWRANTQRFDAADSSVLTAEAGASVSGKPRFRLYLVRLTLQAGNKERQFTFQELAWLPAEQSLSD